MPSTHSHSILPRFTPLLFAVLLLAFGGFSPRAEAEPLTWEPQMDFDCQLFPSYIIATATTQPDEDEEVPNLLGDQSGLIGVAISVPKANTRVRVTVKENRLMEASSFDAIIPEADEEFWVAPKIIYKYDVLRKVKQHVPLNILVTLEVNGKRIGEKSVTATVHSINDCPFGVAASEEIGEDDEEEAEDEDKEKMEDEEEAENDYLDLGWMFAAYVNESHPMIDALLKEALDTEVVESFDGYQSGDPDQVLAQVYSIWNVLQRKGIKYSNITATPGGSKLVYSQHVRFLEESTQNSQANCVDGSVLFASLLRKIDLNPYLIVVPGHMFVGFDLDAEGETRVGLETTMLGSANLKKIGNLPGLKEKIIEDKKNSASLKTFQAAVTTGTENLQKNNEKFEEDNPQFQLIDIAAARENDVMPISFDKE